MSRLASAAVSLLVAATSAPAQFLPPTTPPSGYGGFGGGVRPLGPSILPNPPLITPPGYMNGGGTLGWFGLPTYHGFHSFGHHASGFHGGFGFGSGYGYGGFGYGGGYGLGYGFGGYPYRGYGFAGVYPPLRDTTHYADNPGAVPVGTAVLANEFPATLTVQFPAAAAVWVNGKKADGGPSTEWTLTSPVLKAGESHTFEVKGLWKVGDRTFSSERSVVVASGARSRSLVVAGTEVTE